MRAWQFIRDIDVLVERPRHQISTGMIRLKTDIPFWAYYQNAEEIGGFEVPYAPFGFNSGMGQRNVSVEELAEKGESPWARPARLPDNTSRALPESPSRAFIAMPFESLNTRLTFSTKKIKPDIATRLLDKINGKAEKQKIAPLEYDPEERTITLGERHKSQRKAERAKGWEAQQKQFFLEKEALMQKNERRAKDYTSALGLSETNPMMNRELTDIEKWMLSFEEFETGAHFSKGKLKNIYGGTDRYHITKPTKMKAGDVFTHVHVKGKPFSDSDIEHALRNPKAYVAAIGRDLEGARVIYTVTTDKNLSEDEIRDIIQVYRRKCNESKKRPDGLAARWRAVHFIIEKFSGKLEIFISRV